MNVLFKIKTEIMKQLYIPYYRVSTDEQGISGLGLAGQKNYVRNYITSQNGEIVAEYQDVETGKSDCRDSLMTAIHHCKQVGATLIAYDLTRISRGGIVVMAEIQKTKIDFISAENPHDSDFMKLIKFAVAKDEVDRLSRNTKKALSVIKEKLSRGEVHISKSGKVVTKLGSPKPMSSAVSKMGAAAMKKKAFDNIENKKAGALVISLRDDSGRSFYDIAKQLNKAGFKTTRGKDYSDVQVKRLYERYSN